MTTKIKTFSDYTYLAQQTEDAPNSLPPEVYFAMGLAGEAGEVLEQIKKLHRNDSNSMTKERLSKIELELGDVIWYWSMLIKTLGLDPEEVSAKNIEKLAKRKAERTIKTDERTDEIYECPQHGQSMRRS